MKAVTALHLHPLPVFPLSLPLPLALSLSLRSQSLRLKLNLSRSVSNKGIVGIKAQSYSMAAFMVVPRVLIHLPMLVTKNPNLLNGVTAAWAVSKVRRARVSVAIGTDCMAVQPWRMMIDHE